MNRRLFALIVFIGALAFPVLMYMYFFVYYTGSVRIHSNTGDFNVNMFSKSTAQKTSFECVDADCLLTDLSPFEYNVTLSKDGYRDITFPLEVKARDQVQRDIVFEKKPYLEPLSIAEKAENTQEKIKRLRDQANYDSILSFSGSYDLGINQQDTGLMKLTLLGSERDYRLGEFRSELESIDIAPVYGSESDFYLNIAGENYLYNLSQNKLSQLALSPIIEYVHTGRSLGEYLIFTEVGAYSFNSQTGKLEYQYLFEKYVPFENNIIGIIRTDDEQRRNNFAIKNSGDLVLIYNQSTKEKRILYTSHDAIDKMYMSGGEELILEIRGELYSLQNF